MAKPPAGSSLLFGALADSGRIKERKNGSYRLVLKGMDKIDWYTDRPYRVTGKWSAKKLAKKWDSLFADSSPNAQLTFKAKGKERITTVEVLKPEVSKNGQQATFKLAPLNLKQKSALAQGEGLKLKDPYLNIDPGVFGGFGSGMFGSGSNDANYWTGNAQIEIINNSGTDIYTSSNMNTTCGSTLGCIINWHTNPTDTSQSWDIVQYQGTNGSPVKRNWRSTVIEGINGWIWFASPDNPSLRSKLSQQQGANLLTVSLPKQGIPKGSKPALTMNDATYTGSFSTSKSYTTQDEHIVYPYSIEPSYGTYDKLASGGNGESVTWKITFDPIMKADCSGLGPLVPMYDA